MAMTKAQEVIDALQGAFTCCETRYRIPPHGTVGDCPHCGLTWGLVAPGMTLSDLIGAYISRDDQSGLSSWRSFGITGIALEEL